MNIDARLATAARPDLSVLLTRQVVDLIRRDGLRPGDRLPPAKALAERFAVATPTLREALRRLQATGVIEIRHGSGIYVRRDHERLMLANPGSGALDPDTLVHLLDARQLIEPQAAELAAGRADDATLAELDGLLAAADRALDHDDAALRRANMAFHLAIARASGNPILAQVVESLLELHTAEQLAILWLYNARGRDHRDHLALRDALRGRDAAAARERMRHHLAEVRAVVAARLDDARADADEAVRGTE